MMVVMVKGTRESMIQAAASLLGTAGLEGTSFSTVLDASGAPRGSIYHHFPDGKAQLVREATAWVGGRLTRALQSMRGQPAGDVARAFLAMWRGVLERSGCAAGCAIAAVTTDAGDDEALSTATREVFAEWTAVLADVLAAGGVPRRRSVPLATLLVAGVEGALVLARAARDIASFDTVAAELQRQVDATTRPRVARRS
jgi:TetR/AcrR family transcriptional repressor of lmrAB and yxaGH operons